MSKDNNAARTRSETDLADLVSYGSFKKEGMEVILLTDPARLTAHIRIVGEVADSTLSDDEVTEFLGKCNVRMAECARANIATALKQAASGGSNVGSFLVAEGSPAGDGRDGTFEWLVRAPDVPQNPQSPNARVDYKERFQLVNVRQGQKILTLAEPTAGKPGQDVFGNPIPPQIGRPADIRRGKNVEFTDEGKTLVALASGYVEASGGAVSVEPVLSVNGDVDLSVGNINFIGPVKVTGDVLDGFRIVAEQEIEVNGIVEAAHLDSGSFIHVNGGITGKGKGRVVCKGDLEARYLNEVHVQAGGDVTVANSIVNSTVKSLGAVRLASGGIRGASVIARKGLHSPEIGSDLGVRTFVVVGVDFNMKGDLVNVEREMAVVVETVAKIENALGPSLSDTDLLADLPPEKAEAARRLIVQLNMLVAKGNDLAARREKMLAKMALVADTFIEVDKQILPGVVMQIGPCTRIFDEPVPGPIKLRPDIENASITVSR